MIYLDYAATTPVSKPVLEAMLPFFDRDFGNAASIDHTMGAFARTAVDNARAAVADLVGAAPEDVIFTSGSTEANNLVLNVSGSVVTSTIEHPSILDTLAHRSPGDKVFPVQVDGLGKVDVTEFETRLRESAPALATIVFVNNEVGTRQDVQMLASVAAARNVAFHTDATQAMITEKLDMRQMGIDAVSLSAHKIYGPKGVGALVCRSPLRRKLSPVAFGGGHERGLRSGTLNVPGIVGFAEAVRRAARLRADRVEHLSHLRSTFLRVLGSRYAGTIVVNGADASPHICSVRLAGVNNRALLKATVGKLCFSLGSACATTKNEPSHVLMALGQSKVAANETIRISFGEDTAHRDVESAAECIAAAANHLLQLVA